MHKAMFESPEESFGDRSGHLALGVGLEITSSRPRAPGSASSAHQVRFESGLRSGVHKTPTLFINGRRYDGPVDAESILDALPDSAR